MSNQTSNRPINLVSSTTTTTANGNNNQSPAAAAAQQLRVSIHDLQIEGLKNPKVSNVYVNKKNMKLHVVFNYKTIRVSGRCSSSGPQKPSQMAATGSKVLLEATNWNTSWSASVMPMIGREHFDMSKVHSSHAQQRLSLNLKECPQAMHEKLKTALLDRIKSNIDSRLVEIMETVIMQTDAPDEDFVSTTSSPIQVIQQQQQQQPPQPQPQKPRGKRAPVLEVSKKTSARQVTKQSKGNLASTSPKKPNPIMKTSSGNKSQDRMTPVTKQGQKILKRTKRQTPCQQGEELDDYVDQLFRFGTRIIRAMEPITLPNTTIELPDYNLKIFLYEGKGTRAYKFRRTKGAWVFCSNETISLGLTIEVEELRVAYKYRVISGNRLLFDGDLEAKLSPKVQAQFSQAVQEEDSEEPVQQRVDRVRVFRLGRVHVVIRGLGNLTQSLSMIINSYLNDNQEELQPTFRMVEGDAVKMINKMLANVNVPLLSVV